jgi:hypothetical protein
MNIMSMESIFLLLSGVILIAGVLYWFWSHIQLTQKKVQLLENAVFELRGMVTSGSVGTGPGAGSGSPAAVSPAYDDLPDDDWAQDEQAPAGVEGEMRSTPLTDIGAGAGGGFFIEREGLNDVHANADLMPGAPSLIVNEMIEEENSGETEKEKEEFRELFVSQDAATPVRTPESLDAMPVKELRRLAEQRGIAGAADMRKKEILAALRKQVQPAGEVAVQKTLDLTVEETVPEDVAEPEAEILE